MVNGKHVIPGGHQLRLGGAERAQLAFTSSGVECRAGVPYTVLVQLLDHQGYQLQVSALAASSSLGQVELDDQELYSQLMRLSPRPASAACLHSKRRAAAHLAAEATARASSELQINIVSVTIPVWCRLGALLCLPASLCKAARVALSCRWRSETGAPASSTCNSPWSRCGPYTAAET